jgi:hypothetical protein
VILFAIQPATLARTGDDDGDAISNAKRLAMQPVMARQPVIIKRPAGEDAAASDETATALHGNGGSSEENATATPAARDAATTALQ